MLLDRIILAPYYLILKARHAMFDHGFLRKSREADVPTICVGNITAGGTGKTPHTEMILKMLLTSFEWGGTNIAVLSRGHRRSSHGFQQVTSDEGAQFCGDEPLQIKKEFPTITVAVDRSRIEGCNYLCHPEKLSESKRGMNCKHKDYNPSDIIVLDDAYQYRELKATVNIVLVDYNRPVNKDMLLPFGRLRDLPERVAQADIVIVTKCPAYLEDYEKISIAKSLGVKDLNPRTCKGRNKQGKEIVLLFTFISYCPLVPVYKEVANPRYIYSKKLILFTGIAKDTPLRRYLSDSYEVVRHFSFMDHHKYKNRDMDKIYQAAKENPTAVVVTTAKDAQRVLDNKSVDECLKERMFQVPIQVYFLSEEERQIFEQTLLSYLRNFHKKEEQQQ